MSGQGNRIVCRRCNETIATEGGSCPQCGASIRSDTPYILGLVFGLVILGAMLLDPSSLLAFGIVGLLVAAGSGYMLYEKRQRMEQASELAQEMP